MNDADLMLQRWRQAGERIQFHEQGVEQDTTDPATGERVKRVIVQPNANRMGAFSRWCHDLVLQGCRACRTVALNGTSNIA